MSNENNTSDSLTYDLYEIVPWVDNLFKFLYYSVSVISVIGNLLIILIVIKNKKMHNVNNYFILNLSVVDVIISIFSTPFQVFFLNIN